MCYRGSAWDVLFHPLADVELSKVPAREGQPQIARLEKAEHQPSFDTIAKLTRATGLTFRFEAAHGGIELLSA